MARPRRQSPRWYDRSVRRRAHDGRLLALAAVLCLVVGAARGQAPATLHLGEPSASWLRFDTPPELTAGQRARVGLVVNLPQDLPVLVTPRSESTALAVVRGRLLREDAYDGSARPLRFPIPVVTRSAGTAILRVHVASFACDGEECVPIEAEASLTLRIGPATP